MIIIGGVIKHCLPIDLMYQLFNVAMYQLDNLKMRQFDDLKMWKSH